MSFDDIVDEQYRSDGRQNPKGPLQSYDSPFILWVLPIAALIGFSFLLYYLLGLDI